MEWGFCIGRPDAPHAAQRLVAKPAAWPPPTVSTATAWPSPNKTGCGCGCTTSANTSIRWYGAA